MYYIVYGTVIIAAQQQSMHAGAGSCRSKPEKVAALDAGSVARLVTQK
jgi:hypothetical protein